MPRKGTKGQPKDKKYNGVLVRGLKPSTVDWLEKQKDRDKPTKPAVIREIIEQERRRQSG
jgi:hypothetical protein